MNINTAPDTLPWYKSKIMLGNIVAVVCLVGTGFGLFAAISPEGQAGLVEDILTIVGAGGAITSAIARITQKFAPAITIVK